MTGHRPRTYSRTPSSSHQTEDEEHRHFSFFFCKFLLTNTRVSTVSLFSLSLLFGSDIFDVVLVVVILLSSFFIHVNVFAYPLLYIAIRFCTVHMYNSFFGLCCLKGSKRTKKPSSTRLVLCLLLSVCILSTRINITKRSVVFSPRRLRTNQRHL